MLAVLEAAAVAATAPAVPTVVAVVPATARPAPTDIPSPTTTATPEHLHADLSDIELPDPIATVTGGLDVAEVERVTAELLSRWWFPAQPISYPDLAGELYAQELISERLRDELAVVDFGSLRDQSGMVTIVDLAAMTVGDGDATVSVISDRGGRKQTVAFLLVFEDDAWRVDSLT